MLPEPRLCRSDESRPGECSDCAGTGRWPGDWDSEEQVCETCQGTGTVDA